ncbi:hypothetical protein AAHA92_03013 [Salvia divinorum]|uniref:Uncharacterized protein n=1 Tax=Salvia divinorum TaxID=28513 RepID=A0ABD1IGJ6_SALDI
MPDNLQLMDLVRATRERTLLDTVRPLSVCQDPVEKEVIRGLIHHLSRQLAQQNQTKPYNITLPPSPPPSSILCFWTNALNNSASFSPKKKSNWFKCWK